MLPRDQELIHKAIAHRDFTCQLIEEKTMCMYLHNLADTKAEREKKKACSIGSSPLSPARCGRIGHDRHHPRIFNHADGESPRVRRTPDPEQRQTATHSRIQKACTGRLMTSDHFLLHEERNAARPSLRWHSVLGAESITPIGRASLSA